MPLRRPRLAVAASALLVAGAVVGSVPAQASDTGDSAPSTSSVRVEAGGDDGRAGELVAAMTLREKAASVIMGHIPTTDVAALRDYMQPGLGGFILMGANVPGTEAGLQDVTAALTLDAAVPPLIAIDQEGGDVSRLPWDDFPGAVSLKNEDVASTYDAFAGRGALVARAGANVNFGIVADVTDDPGMFIYRRALGTTPEAAASRVAAAIAGETATVASTTKHFPGHGAAPGDSHRGIPSSGMSYDEWWDTEAVPFREGIAAGAPLVMFGHLRYTAIDDAPASVSEEWHRIAREDLGFDGVIVTDDLGMLEASGDPQYSDPVQNGVDALRAGNDLLLAILYTDAGSADRLADGIVAAVEDGSLDVARLDEAATRVMTLRLETAAAGATAQVCADCAPAE